MNIKRFKLNYLTITLILYWLFLSLNVLVSKTFSLPIMVEWWMNTFILYVIVLLCLFTYRTTLKLYSRLLIIPLSWIVHAIMTIPAAFVLGILMYDPNNLRTSGEHRAVFILASIPLLLFMMSNSKLYLKE